MGRWRAGKSVEETQTRWVATSARGGGGTAPCAEVSEQRVGHSKDGERTVPLWPCAVTTEDQREARPPAKSSLSGHRHGSPPVAGRRRRGCDRQPPHPGRRVAATPPLSPPACWGSAPAGGWGRGGSRLPTNSHWRRGIPIMEKRVPAGWAAGGWGARDCAARHVRGGKLVRSMLAPRIVAHQEGGVTQLLPVCSRTVSQDTAMNSCFIAGVAPKPSAAQWC